MKPIKVGICGSGAVGGGTSNVLERSAEEIACCAGCDIEIAQIVARRPNPRCDTGATLITADIFDVACNPEIDVVAKPIGSHILTHELVLKAIENGEHVVTTDKVLIAMRGNETLTKARERGMIAAFEAAVTGGIPAIKAIRERLSVNRISWLIGIINGTSSFVFNEMRERDCTFPGMPAKAQALGYAEADPTFNVEGIDTAHKLIIPVLIAFGIPLQLDKAYTEGISRLTSVGVSYAGILDYRTKHLDVARRIKSGFELHIHPTLIPSDRLIANVNGVMSAVMVSDNVVSSTLYHGAGAGMEPIASSVAADLVDVVHTMTSGPENRVPYLAFQSDALSNHPILPIEACESAYYLRTRAKDHPGVLARVAAILSERGINIESIMQKGAEEQNGLVPMILVIRRVIGQRINDAIVALGALGGASGSMVRIRIEQLN